MAARTLRIKIGGLTLRVVSPRQAACLVPPRRLDPFLADRGADMSLDLVEGSPPATSPRDLLFDSGRVWRVHRLGAGLLYTFRSRVLDPPLYKAVSIDGEFARGQLFFPPARRGRRPRYALEYPLDELLFQHRLAREGALEVHACGIVWGGRAILFSGRSGAGKSTTARLWHRRHPDALVLGDDRIVLRRQQGVFQAYGTPWHGTAGFASPQRRRLGAIFFLRHGRRNRLTRLAPAAAASRLFSRSFPPMWEGAVLFRALETCAQIASGTPCYDFAFTPDASAVAAAKAVLRDEHE